MLEALKEPEGLSEYIDMTVMDTRKVLKSDRYPIILSVAMAINQLYIVLSDHANAAGLELNRCKNRDLIQAITKLFFD